jgi:putative hemolysin
MFLFLLAVAIVLIVSFLCSIFESVLLSLRRPQIELMVQQGSRAGTLLAGFKENMDVPIAAILILNTAAHTIGAAVAGASYADAFSPSTLWLFSILFTIAVLFFTEIVPKTLGVSHAVTLATPVAYSIEFLTRMLKPLVLLSERISRSIRGDAQMPVTSVEEIRLLASLGRSQGAVGGRTAGMIIGAAQLRALHAYDVMLPREEVDFLVESMSRDDVLGVLREAGHSRFPLSKTRDLNDVRGLVYTTEILHWMLEHPDGPVDWNALCHDATFVPRSIPLMQLLRTIQEHRRHLVIVVDEYGGVEGIASIEDVLEEIVGDIYDENDVPLEDILEQEDGTLVVNARVDLRKLSGRLGIAWDAAAEASTIGGLVTETLEAIPVVGDSIVWNGYRIEVLRADRRRVRLVAVRPQAR